MTAQTDRSLGSPAGLRTLRTGEAVIGLLETYGVDVVFGIPGVHTIELYRGLAGSRIRHVTARHEQGAAFMADGYARVTGRPGVCTLISGPGVTNAATPIAQAFHDSVPLLVLASTTATHELGRGLGPLHDLPDQALLLRSITALSETVTDPAALPDALARAWAIFEGRRPRPVHVAIPTDVLALDCPPLRRLAADIRRPEADPLAIEPAAELLASAERPAILLGGGATDAGPEALKLAELIGAPIALTGNAKGTVSSVHPLCLGATLPLESVQALLAAADVVLLVGTELSEVDTIYSGRALRFGGRIVRIDIDEMQLGRSITPEVGLHSDARAALASLATALRGHPRRLSRESGTARVARARRGIRWTRLTESHLPWLDAIDAALPQDRIVVLDSTQLAYSAHQYLPATTPRSWIAPYGYGTLGPALPMAIGARIGAPDRPVAVIAGDAGILFTISELATAVDLELPLPIVVWDNAGYGEIRDAFDRAGAPRVGTETSAFDLEMIARGFGCEVVRATTPAGLQTGLVDALARRGPTVIRVPASGP